MTKEIVLAEKSIHFHLSHHSWSKSLAKTILDVQFWKLKLSIIRNKQSRQKCIDNIINRMNYFDHSSTSINCNNIKRISKYFRE